MTTFFDGHKFWVIDSVTGKAVETFPAFDTFAEARTAIGDRWTDSTMAQDQELDL